MLPLPRIQQTRSVGSVIFTVNARQTRAVQRLDRNISSFPVVLGSLLCGFRSSGRSERRVCVCVCERERDGTGREMEKEMLRVLGCRPNAEAVEAARQALVEIDMRLSSDLAKNVASVSTYTLVGQDDLKL